MPERKYRTARAAGAARVGTASRHRVPARRASSGLLAITAAAATLALAACGASGSSTTSAQSPKTFGVNATGTVHFWARQATDGPAKSL
jgi:hypothetical protein